MKYFLRTSVEHPKWAQDHPTYIAVGKWTHFYNANYDVWFHGYNDMGIDRPGCSLTPIAKKTWVVAVGKEKAKQILWEEFTGIRLPMICRRIATSPFWRFIFFKILKMNKVVFRVMERDDSCDFSKYDRECEPIRFDSGDLNEIR